MVYVYDAQLVKLYGYKGARHIFDWDIRIVLVAIAAMFAGLLLPVRLKMPGDYFILVFFLFCVPQIVILNGVSLYHDVNFPYVFSIGVAISIMGLANIISRKNNYAIARTDCPDKRTIYALVAILFFVSVYVLIVTHSFFSIGYDGYHIRRILAKEVIISGSISAYVVSIVLQGLFPILLTYSVLSKNKIILLTAMFSIAVLWGGFGERYVIAMSIFLVLLMKLHIMGKKLGVGSIIPLMMIGLFVALSLTEEMINGTRVIADNFLRRIFAVPAVINDAYISYLDAYGFNRYCDSTLSSIFCEDRSEILSYEVSRKIIQDDYMNANTNFMTYSYGNFGLASLVIESAIVGCVIYICNIEYSRKYSLFMLSISFIFALRLIEKALLTTLFSSGIAFLILISLIIYKRKLNARL